MRGDLGLLRIIAVFFSEEGDFDMIELRFSIVRSSQMTCTPFVRVEVILLRETRAESG